MGSSSTSINRTVSADTEALVGSEGSVLTRDQAKAVVASGQLSQSLESGGVALGGSGNKNVLGGVELGGSNSGTISINDPNAFKPITETLSNTVNKLADTADLNTQKFVKLVEQQSAQNAALAESKQTDGISSLGKLALWGMAIAAIAFVAAVWKWRSGK